MLGAGGRARGPSPERGVVRAANYVVVLAVSVVVGVVVEVVVESVVDGGASVDDVSLDEAWLNRLATSDSRPPCFTP